MQSIMLAAAVATSMLVTPLAAAAPEPVAESWSVDVSAVSTEDTNVTVADGRLRLGRGRSAAAGAADPAPLGSLTTVPRRLAAPADRVTAVVDAAEPPGTAVLVEVRGQGRAEGLWGEWTPAGDPLAAPTIVVQVRVTLRGTPDGTGPEVGAVRVTAHPAATTAVAPVGEPLSFDVFATRVGLVGRTTANGHVITERDQFVALPSRRGLSGRGTGDYTVRVCAANGRCAWAPVWDVGPWNTRDDYWNVPGVRQNWADLPQGLPQAQAAVQSGYNGGRDQYDRRVRNPAGIDLGDGTFWDGLRLSNNGWVTVTYLWTGGGAAVGTVTTTGGPLNVRTTPDTVNAPVGLAGNHAMLPIACQVAGQWATGTQGTSDLWLRIAPGRYVAKAHVNAAPTPPCG